ncbi:MAG: lipoprotein-releasing ABC transporter permease subunit [Humidesulfovibrio sp.]|jgi:lipoprotein-releasing system permease protein|uniref:lipoprotein-releasing ABC transporter permease subunit n=1 Tax=Humidesulfovibrio sp. TaxID=2910988 RepID=UPI0027361F55|nr:lipoprotein-releasing ABC transporter permease subunit [Humidesulfovibrio sp.]MDP2846961.1 lipoprotein-releasing ABC transporter permease subunit [Humidesulfovibrio sp.]
MNFEFLIALRYIFALRKQSFIAVISLFAVCGVAIGVASLIVVIGVMNGFTKDLRDKILGVNAHVIISAFSGGIREHQAMAEICRQVPGVTGVTPFVYSEVMLSASGGVKGVVLRGIETSTADQVLSLTKDMVSGSVKDLEDKDGLPGVVIGAEMAKRLGLGLGATVNLLSPTGTQSSIGFTPKVRVFRVAGIFRTGMYEYDATLGYVTVDAARNLLGFKDNLVSGLEVRLADVYKAGEVSETLRAKLHDYPVYVRNWQEMNANLFAALELEKTAMFIILAMIVLVGSFSIVTMLVMLVMQKTKDIAVLMSLGADEGMIRRIFMYQGSFIGVVGTALGYGIGIPVALLLKKYQFIKLPSDVYPVDYLPVRLELLDMTFIGVAALALCFLSTLYPARRAAALKPSDALRYE